MNRDILVVWLAVCLVGSLVALLRDDPLSFAWSIGLILTLSLALGALRDGRFGPFLPYLVAALAVWLFSFAAMMLWAVDVGRLWGGLPAPTAVMVYVLWLAPLLLTALPYAVHFDRFHLTQDDLDALQRVLDADAVKELEEALE